ncbi:hypothetical protein P8452_27697 [Trifolium repens]|nr:hypothetical protein P8452_27697 [Trifolium repens]
MAVHPIFFLLCYFEDCCAVFCFWLAILIFGCWPSFYERLLRTQDGFVWPVDTAYVGRFIIDVEFLDLKICHMNLILLGGKLKSERMRNMQNFDTKD